MGWNTQHDDKDTKVQVSGGYARNEERTDFLIIDKASGEHQHISVSSSPGSDVVEHHDYEPPKS